MAKGFVRLPPDSTGKRLATDVWQQEGEEVHAESAVLYHPDGSVVDLATQDKQNATNVLLTAIRDHLKDPIALDEDSLQALENITVTVDAPITSVTLTNPTKDPETGLAKEVTLQGVAKELTLTSILTASEGAQTALEAILSQVDDPSGDTLISILKALRTAQTALSTSALQDAGNDLLESIHDVLGDIETALGGTLTIDGTVAVSGAVTVTNQLDVHVVNPTTTVTVSNPTANPETGLAKQATLTDGTQKTQVTNLPATQAVTGTVAVSNLPATQPVSGTVAVSNLPAKQDVDVKNFPATQPVSGTVAVSNLPATQPVSGTISVGNFPSNQAVTVSNFPATQPVSGTVSVGNFPSSQAVTGTVAVSNLPATQPVSGTVAVNNFPATQTITGQVQDMTQLVPKVYDHISLSYASGEISGVVYKQGGPSGSTVATLTLGYTNGELTSVTRT